MFLSGFLWIQLWFLGCLSLKSRVLNLALNTTWLSSISSNASNMYRLDIKFYNEQDTVLSRRLTCDPSQSHYCSDCKYSPLPICISVDHRDHSLSIWAESTGLLDLQRSHVDRIQVESTRDYLASSTHEHVVTLQYPNIVFQHQNQVYPIYPSSSGPMHITCLTIGTRGDVQPFIALCLGLIKQGHTCRIATHIEFKPWIEGFGIEFRKIEGDPSALIFVNWVEHLLESAWIACQDTDMIIEAPTAMAGVHIAEKLNIPHMGAFPFPWLKSSTYAHPLIAPLRQRSGAYNRISNNIVEHIFRTVYTPYINRWRVNTLGLPAKKKIRYTKTYLPFVYSFSSAVVPPPKDSSPNIYTSGYWFLDNSELNWTPPAGLMEFLERGPTVYIGFGSVIVDNAQEITRIIVQAVKKAGIQAIVCKGWLDRKNATRTNTDVDLQASSDSIYYIKSIPHDWLFPRLAGVVHHGGAGTTAAGLRAGIPTIIKPFFGDQFFWAQRVEALNVGVALSKLSVKKLSKALVKITTDHQLVLRAKRLGLTLRSEDGVGNAVRFIQENRQLKIYE